MVGESNRALLTRKYSHGALYFILFESARRLPAPFFAQRSYGLVTPEKLSSAALATTLAFDGRSWN